MKVMKFFFFKELKEFYCPFTTNHLVQLTIFIASVILLVMITNLILSPHPLTTSYSTLTNHLSGKNFSLDECPSSKAEYIEYWCAAVHPGQELPLPVPCHFTYSSMISSTQNAKDLGITLDKDLSFTAHILTKVRT